jgi:hypothetical protein
MALITTTKGLWPEEALERREGGVDDDNERTTWVEYWLDGDCVHRSAAVFLKKAMLAESQQANLG